MGASYGTGLDMELRRRNLKTIIIGGISTNYGAESTARDAYERGYQLIFASDAVASRASADHEFAITRITI
jgi:nicotinamidase-related amidase